MEKTKQLELPHCPFCDREPLHSPGSPDSFYVDRVVCHHCQFHLPRVTWMKLATRRPELVGWQWRFVFTGGVGEWCNVMPLPCTMKSGDYAPGRTDVHFEVRHVYAGPVRKPGETQQ